MRTATENAFRRSLESIGVRSPPPPRSIIFSGQEGADRSRRVGAGTAERGTKRAGQTKAAERAERGTRRREDAGRGVGVVCLVLCGYPLLNWLRCGFFYERRFRQTAVTQTVGSRLPYVPGHGIGRPKTRSNGGPTARVAMPNDSCLFSSIAVPFIATASANTWFDPPTENFTSTYR
jgi:hypothetical protein